MDEMLSTPPRYSALENGACPNIKELGIKVKPKSMNQRCFMIRYYKTAVRVEDLTAVYRLKKVT